MRTTGHKAFVLSRKSTNRSRGWVASAAALAAAGSLVAAQAPAQPHPAAARAVAGPADAVISLVSVNRIELKRHRGFIEGDGRTVYVGNRTTFRPRRTTVAIPPQVRARSWVVVDLDTGRLLGSHEARAWLPQASTMKLLTALTAIRTIRPGTAHRVTRYETSQTCTCAGLKRGRYYSRNTLLAGMLLPSGNDAAEAVAGSHPGGRRAFYRAMNDLARELGALDTVAKNASGLTAAGSHSSARDLVILLRAAIAEPTIHRILAKRSATIATVSGRARHTVWRGTDYVNRYPNSLGKSGWTTPAQNTLAVMTEIDGHRIAVASLGAPGGYSTSGARALTEWANANFDGLNAVGRLPLS
ncbi:MAG TPA: serine hydrolase [Nocardioidaceae bacterium]|nr:serine hydrolase [Nocardioidaceae bacterium]